MRIYIVGLPGSGKTTMAKSLALKRQLTHIELDQLFHQLDGTNYTRNHFEDIHQDVLTTISDTDNWVIEGVYPITEVYQQADKVIYLQENVLRCLYRQWKRYATDPLQRDKARFGIGTNIGLSLMIIGLACNIWGVKVYKNQPRITHKKFFDSEKLNDAKTKIVKGTPQNYL